MEHYFSNSSKIAIVFLLFCLLFFSTTNVNGQGKSTYIPSYYSSIEIQGNDFQTLDSTISRKIKVISPNKQYSIEIEHDSITLEQVKQIKRAKTAANWSEASAIFSGISNILNPLNNARDALRYIQNSNGVLSGTMLSIINNEEASKLQQVNVDIKIDNLSDDEISVNDMNRGLIWFIPSHQQLILSAESPEFDKFRISSTKEDGQKTYVSIQIGNTLNKKNITYQDETCWIIPVIQKNEIDYEEVNICVGYIYKDKITMQEIFYSKETGDEIIKNKKKK